MGIDPDSPEFGPFNDRMDRYLDSLSVEELNQLITSLLKFHSLMAQYVMQVDRDLFDRAKDYAESFVGPEFHEMRSKWGSLDSN